MGYRIINGILNLFLFQPETKLLENIIAINLYNKYGEELYYYNVEPLLWGFKPHPYHFFFLNKPFTLFTAPLVAFDTLLPTDFLPPDTAEAGLSFSSAALGVSGVSG